MLCGISVDPSQQADRLVVAFALCMFAKSGAAYDIGSRNAGMHTQRHVDIGDIAWFVNKLTDQVRRYHELFRLM